MEQVSEGKDEKEGPLLVLLAKKREMWGKRRKGQGGNGKRRKSPIIKQWIAKSFFPVPPCFSVSSFKSFYCSLLLCRPFCSASDNSDPSRARERERK